MSGTGLVQIIEGALLAAGRPLTMAQLAELFEEHERPENAAIREALQEPVAAIVEPAILPSSSTTFDFTLFNIKCKLTRTLLLVTFLLPCSEPCLTRRSIQAALTSNPAVMRGHGRAGLFMDGN